MTRRSFAAAAAASVIALPLRAAAASISPVMKRLSSYMTEAGTGPLPQEALEKTKQHILDTFAAMVSGSELAPGRFAINFARAHSAEKTATVAASDVVCGAIEAAFSNAMLAHSDETDDSHAPSESHPGASIVPAGARGRRTIQYRWPAIPARRRARLRRRNPRHHDRRRRRFSNRDPHQHPRAGRHLRFGRRRRLRRQS